MPDMPASICFMGKGRDEIVSGDSGGGRDAGQYLFHRRRQEQSEDKLPFGTRWRGKFAAIPKDGPRWEALARKYLR